MAPSSALDPALPVLLLTGDEPLLLQRAEADIISRALPGGRSGFNFSSHSAIDSGDEALSNARTIPMMSRRRVVVLKDFDKATGGLIEQIMAYLASPSDSTLLLIIGPKLPPVSGGKNHGVRLRNLVKKVGAVRKFSGNDVRPDAFIQEHVRAARCTISGQAVRLLIELVGADLGRLQGELDKLISYTGGPGNSIDTDAVEEVCSVVAEAVIWDLTNALVRRDVDRALGATHRMLEEGQASHRLLSTVTWQFRQLLELQEALQQGRGLPGRWARMPSRKVRDAQALLQKQPLQPHVVLGALSDANHAFNRSRAGDRRIFEGLILELVGA
jgi:DNA polymerase-3 subunit delta